ncbi:leucine-rich repeat flightless-interacting protein 1 isoform X1 [Chaetodon trifascialis]|uniref:leucine-rich repeat flightless-interacting protein 1 isoform X1 n=1 Tax=Chaetodon trifascialis TaxID=109706 RepID=UPI003992D0C3
MGTQGTGRKRSTKKERSTAEDDALNLIAREAEARLAAKRAARAEAREIRMKELERQQKELSDDDERMSVGSRGSLRVEDRDYLEKGSRAGSALTAGTLTSLGGTSSRRGSGETAITVDAETSIREIKDALAEVEEKYRKAMVSNAQLDNEKNNLMYQVDTLKDSLMELEEMLSESQRAYEDKVKEFEREKHAHGVLQFQFNEMKETLKQSEELLNDIRQLRLKQEGLLREISDLQETVEWKDKKIAALERQKEYTDAIRVERDDLREEVVKLKDVLKKHGIVLGPDLNINGDIGVGDVDGSPSADAGSQPAPDSQTSPAEGNSMLGNTEETELRSSGGEEVDPEQHQEMFEEAKENHLSCETLCNFAGVSTLQTAAEEQPAEEQQTCLATESEENGLSTDLNKHINDRSITETSDVIDCSPGLQEILSSEENVPKTETPEGGDSGETLNPDLGETETRSSPVDREPENKQEDVDISSLRSTESCPQQTVAEDVTKECLPDESVQTVSNIETQQEAENAEEAENDEAEEMSSKPQAQGAAASGKKKRKKRRGKKKAGTHEDKNQQKDKDKTSKDTEPATRDNEQMTEPDIDSSVTETLKKSTVDQVKNEQDVQETEEVDETFSHSEPLKDSAADHVTEQDKEQSLEMEKVEEVEATETFSNTETPEEKSDHVMDEQNEEQSLEAETVKSVEAVAATETFSEVETLQESRADPKKDEQDEEQSLEMDNVEEVEATETYSNTETPEERSDHVMDEQNEEQSLEAETVKSVEAAAATETFSEVETLQESGADPKKDKQDEEQSLEPDKVEVGSISSPAPEANLSAPDLTDSSKGAENADGLDEVCVSSVDNPNSRTDISTDGNVIHTESEVDDGAEDGVGSVDPEMKSDCIPDNPETNQKENGEAEPHVQSNSDITANESESANKSESKDNMLVSPSSTDGFADGLTSLPGSESPSELSAPQNLASDDTSMKVSDGDPEEATETVKDDEEPAAETEQESTSPSHDGNNSDRTKEEELKGDLRDPESSVEPDSSSHEEKSCDSASLMKNTDASEQSLLDTAAQPEQLDDLQNQTLQCEDQIDEVSSETGAINTTDISKAPDVPKEAPEGSIEQDHDTEEEDDQQSETHPEPSKDKSQDNDSSEPALQDSGDEDGEDDEGQSFDFDDMDMEMAIERNVPINPKQEDVEDEAEVASDESSHVSSGQSNTESNEKAQDEAAENSEEKNKADGGDQEATADTETDTAPHEEATSEDVPVAAEPVTEEATVSIVGESADVAENINQAASLPVEEGLDAMKDMLQGEDSALPKSADQAAGKKEPSKMGKDVKKNAKKGKAKGKEECKMS